MPTNSLALDSPKHTSYCILEDNDKEAVPPIAKKECDRSTWPDGEVENFYAAEKQNADKEEQPAKDEDDLLDMM